MRTKAFIPLLGFMLILMAVSCTDPIEVNPNYNPETDEVKANFVFNVSLPDNPDTKQVTSASQVNNNFWGINTAKLLTYHQTADNSILIKDADANKSFDLGEVASSGTLNQAASRRVLELSLPNNTNTLLFYGRGILPSSTQSDWDDYGHLDAYSVGSTVAEGTVIQLGKRLTKVDEFYTTEKLIAGILSLVMNTNLSGTNHTAIAGNTSPGEGIANYKFDVSADDYPADLSWRSYTTTSGRTSPVETGHELYPLEQKLANAYSQMTTINTAGGELRAGSSEAVIKTVTDLWTIINEVRCAEPMSPAETVAKFLATKVHNRLTKYFDYGTIGTDGSPVTVTGFHTLKDTDNGIIHQFLSTVEVANRPYTDPSSTAAKDRVWPTEELLNALDANALRDFPFNYNLPRGASHMGFDGDKKVFYYPSAFNTSAMGGEATASASGAYNAESYYYPAELVYFGNSPIRTSENEHAVGAYPTGTTAWNTASSWDSDDWNGSHVESSTRSVAMRYDIRYGVALLETKVKYADGVTTLYDNRHQVQVELAAARGETIHPDAEPNNTIDISALENPFLLTGIIIGGQYQNIGWDHLPIAYNGKKTQGFIYDKTIPTDSQKIPTAADKACYTVVFDNFEGTLNDGIWEKGIANNTTEDPSDANNRKGRQAIVYVALEFLNNTGKPFYGNHNVIREGGYFYLIGELNPDNQTISWPEKPGSTTATGYNAEDIYKFPPYDANGQSQKVDRVFVQSFKTSATFVLGPYSLQYAYLTVPDLRAGSMSLGLSVNLNWETGLSFEPILGGNTPKGNN